MATFRRNRSCGATYFFTLATFLRRPLLIEAELITALRDAIKVNRNKHPFDIVAWVVLPDHMHAIWELPINDDDYAIRWASIKREVSKVALDMGRYELTPNQIKRKENGLWQRRFWEHRIRDTQDLQNHLDYVHYNPVKHGLVASVKDWSYSSFHRYVRNGALNLDWGAEPTQGVFGE